MRRAAPLVLLIAASCRSGAASGQFDACYERCVHPAQGECPPGHDWCIVACRAETPTGPRVVAATLTEAPAPISAFPRLLAHSVGIETLGGEFTPLVRQCTALPAEASEVFSTAADDQPQVQIALASGEAHLARDNAPLGTFFLKEIPPAPRAVPQIRVTFRISASGTLTVTARDLLTGKQNVVPVSR